MHHSNRQGIGIDRNTTRGVWYRAWREARILSHADDYDCLRVSGAVLCAMYRLMDRQRVQVHGVKLIRQNQLVDQILDELGY